MRPIKNNGFAGIVFGGFLAVSLARFCFAPGVIWVSLLLVFFAGIAFSIGYRRFKKNLLGYGWLPALMIFGIVMSALVTKTWDRVPQLIIFVLMGYGISVLIVMGKPNSVVAEAVFFVFAAYFAWFVIKGETPQNVFSHISYNGISIVVIVGCICLYIVRYINEKSLIIFPAFVTFFICSYGIGRGGIYSSALLLIGVATIILLRDRSALKFAVVTLIPISHVLL
jgi:hypothetical protein